jgi:hypothetical protein
MAPMEYSGTKEKVIHEKKPELENLMTDSLLTLSIC